MSVQCLCSYSGYRSLSVNNSVGCVKNCEVILLTVDCNRVVWKITIYGGFQLPFNNSLNGESLVLDCLA